MKSKIKAAIVGATGYSGQELLRLFASHNEIEAKYLSSQSYVGQKYCDIYKNSPYTMECVAQDVEKFARECDVIFLALPHGIASKEITENIIENAKVIDLGADFRLSDAKVYEKWYGVEHYGENLLKDAVYGISELNREAIKSARLLANPGCYATCAILSLAPLVRGGFSGNIIIDAKSGVSGAGRTLDTGTLYCECNETLKAYNIASHRHTPEIEQALGALAPCSNNMSSPITFIPHLVPLNRGILATSYIDLSKDLSLGDLQELYAEFYKGEPFIRMTDNAEVRWVKGSNFCDIALFKDERTNKVIITSAIDNLVKGAAGQAVQNLNIMFGFNERTGLEYCPMFP
jgi:N-acetyl-gamma-glutamyl-phosphate reductase